jgi:hypothetical protein
MDPAAPGANPPVAAIATTSDPHRAARATAAFLSRPGRMLDILLGRKN